MPRRSVVDVARLVVAGLHIRRQPSYGRHVEVACPLPLVILGHLSILEEAGSPLRHRHANELSWQWLARRRAPLSRGCSLVDHTLGSLVDVVPTPRSIV